MITRHYLHHKQTLKNIKSEIGKLQAPHAHIDNIRDGKIFFGDDKTHFKVYKKQRKPIETRPMVNITESLMKRPEFIECRYLRSRVKRIMDSESGKVIDNAEPFSFKMAKRISRDQRRDEQSIHKHMTDIAAM